MQAPIEEESAEPVEVASENVKALTEEELATVLLELPWEWPDFFRFLAETGLRISEAIEFRYGDVDGTWLNVDHRRYYRGRVGLPKGSKRRRVPMSVELAQELWRRRVEKAGADEDLVWVTARGKRISPSNVMSRILKPAAVAAGLGEWVMKKDGTKRAETWVGFHTFRHTTATRLFVGQTWNAGAGAEAPRSQRPRLHLENLRSPVARGPTRARLPARRGQRGGNTSPR